MLCFASCLSGHCCYDFFSEVKKIPYWIPPLTSFLRWQYLSTCGFHFHCQLLINSKSWYVDIFFVNIVICHILKNQPCDVQATNWIFSYVSRIWMLFSLWEMPGEKGEKRLHSVWSKWTVHTCVSEPSQHIAVFYGWAESTELFVHNSGILIVGFWVFL